MRYRTAVEVVHLNPSIYLSSDCFRAMSALTSLLILDLAAGPAKTRGTAVVYGLLTAALVFILLLMTGCHA